jgi:hypothetical protein
VSEIKQLQRDANHPISKYFQCETDTTAKKHGKGFALLWSHVVYFFLMILGAFVVFGLGCFIARLVRGYYEEKDTRVLFFFAFASGMLALVWAFICRQVNYLEKIALVYKEKKGALDNPLKLTFSVPYENDGKPQTVYTTWGDQLSGEPLVELPGKIKRWNIAHRVLLGLVLVFWGLALVYAIAFPILEKMKDTKENKERKERKGKKENKEKKKRKEKLFTE